MSEQPLPYEIICNSLTDRERWLAERNSGIGASEAAAALGLSPYDSPLALYVRKLGLEDVVETGPMRWGHKLQGLILEEYQEDRPAVEVREYEWLLRSNSHPHILATPDAMQRDRTDNRQGSVQVKSSAVDSWQDGVPPWVQIQIQHELFVTGLDWATAVLLDLRARETVWKDVRRDDAFIEKQLLPGLQIFWERLQNREAPSPQIAEDGAALARLYARETEGLIVDDRPHLIELVRRRRELKEEAKAVESDLAEVENELKATIGEAEGLLLVDGSKVTWKHQHKPAGTVAAADFRVLRVFAPRKT